MAKICKRQGVVCMPWDLKYTILHNYKGHVTELLFTEKLSSFERDGMG